MVANANTYWRKKLAIVLKILKSENLYNSEYCIWLFPEVSNFNCHKIM